MRFNPRQFLRRLDVAVLLAGIAMTTVFAGVGIIWLLVMFNPAALHRALGL